MLFTIIGCSNSGKLPVSDTAKQKTTDDVSGMKVHYIDVGQADATLLEIQEKNETFTMLIDTGDWNATDAVDYLKTQNIEVIDLIAITHPHADHIGQLEKIIQTFEVAEVWMNGEIANSQVFAKSLEAIEEHDIDYYEPKIGETFDIGKLQIEVLHPDSLSSNTNNNSLTMRMQYADVSFLFTGDAEQQAENELLARGVNVNAMIFHLGHHGSKTSNTVDFLKAVQPDIAIYSAGVGNSYGHPDTEVVQLMKENKIPLYGTDTHGTIILDTDGKEYRISTEKNDAANDSCININTASQSELQKIIHIGPTLAAELVKLRPYESLHELTKINGIGDARLQDIQVEGIACLGG